MAASRLSLTFVRRYCRSSSFLNHSSPFSSTVLTRSFSAGGESDDAFKPVRKAPSASSAPPPSLDSKGVKESIEKTIRENDVVLYMKGTPASPQCGFSNQAVRILNQHGVNIHGVNILEDQVMRQAMKDFSKWPTFPQVYVKGEFVGGCDILTQMHNNGELKTMLQSAGLSK
jgi:monothiol glutaredoxin